MEDKSLIDDSAGLTFSNEVVKRIAKIAILEVKGILFIKENIIEKVSNSLASSNVFSKGLHVQIGKTQTLIHFQVVLEFGYSAPEIFSKLELTIQERVKYMTGLDLVELNMHVVDILTKEEWSKKSSETSGLNNVLQ
ncbi:Asp23/Gls24 family envelope stress response protein [Staphylococcus xylosus]|uniref:Asp23/Gls24 family envelope stress response protein n=1 Tax=Staphylococcus xylosus TaxID=1288 RepID=UPI000E698B40|nr:Asp23/Gls24 family envelope stress response protein [Staphylococcus xylosus]RIM86180.1 Asp23/Gls24 family envelope stress response protein [Staphylococcus xylosus]